MTTEYIVFQPDQVLTDKNLNEQFNYLDQQNRWTRNKLLGTGIVCGLDISYNHASPPGSGTITISKGSGITSEGYLILMEQDTSYSHIQVYTKVPPPADLDFISSPPGSVPFYNGYTGTSPDPIYLLIDNNATNSAPVCTVSPPVTSSLSLIPDLSKYLVVLFLEADESDLRSCSTQSCNNTGKEIVFTVRPLLVLITDLAFCSPPTNGAMEIKLQRYNVPPIHDLKQSKGVLTAFYDIVKNDVLTEIDSAYNYCYNKYKYVLYEKQNPFAPPVLPTSFTDQLKTLREQIWTAPNWITIQYIYDYINDLILAYYEFREVADQYLATQCYGDETAFPMHLVLGVAGTTTSDFIRDNYRYYFKGTPILENHNATKSKLRFLFGRMKLLASPSVYLSPPVPLASPASPPLSADWETIKITPSHYQAFPLSDRAIPYYYNPASKLNQHWNYHKALNGANNFVFGYNADKYTPAPYSAVNPLHFDIEYYNFFRIEGHIGQQHDTVLNNILDQRLKYNLPFDVVAIPAELLSSKDVVLPACNILDLETDYRQAVTEFLYQLYICLYKYSMLDFSTKYINTPEISTINELVYRYFTSTNHDIEYKLIFEDLHFNFSKYNYGNFYQDFSPPLTENTVGYYYQKNLANKDYNNPVKDENNAYYSLFNMLNSVDVLFFTLLNSKLNEITSETFVQQYDYFNTQLSEFNILILPSPPNPLSVPTVQTSDCCCNNLIPLAEGLLVIFKEYKKRLEKYHSQLNFLNYFKKHPGLEHKAGVPKGGTFVLVYHSSPPVEAMKVTEYLVEAQTTSSKMAIAKPVEATIKSPTDVLIELETIYKQNPYLFTLDQFKTIKYTINNIISPPSSPPAEFKILDGAIIADFYVPYMCCSDCAPVAYIYDNKPTAYYVSGGGTICEGNTADIILSGSDTGINYELYDNNNLPSRPIPVQAGTGGPLTFKATPNTGGVNTYTIMATNSQGNAKNLMIGSAIVTVIALPDSIIGPSAICVGQRISLADSSGGGIWSISPPSVATIDPDSGILSGVSPGSATIHYTLTTGCFTSKDIIVNALPAAISGPTNVCLGIPITLTSVTPGGTWTSSPPSVATVGTNNGIVTGISPGSATIYYSVNGCPASTDITVNAIPTATITAPANPQMICLNSPPKPVVIPVTGSIDIGTLKGSGEWSTSPPGLGTFSPPIFSPPNQVNTSFIPNKTSESITLVLSPDISHSNKCSPIPATALILFNQVEPPSVTAGTKNNIKVVCAGGTINLDGKIIGSFSNTKWSASPPGTFSDINALNPTFTPNPSIGSGPITLTLTANPTAGSPCDVVSNFVVIKVIPPPTAEITVVVVSPNSTTSPPSPIPAGASSVVVNNVKKGTSVKLTGKLNNGATSGIWTMSPPSSPPATGFFTQTDSPPTAPTAIYVVNMSEFKQGSNVVTFTLTTNAVEPCGPAVSSVQIRFILG